MTAERPSPPERQFESPSGTAAPTAEGASIIPDLLHMIRQRMEALRPLVDEAAALEPHLQSWSAMRAPPRPLLGASPSKRLDAAALILKARELGEFSVRELAEALGDAEATTAERVARLAAGGTLLRRAEDRWSVRAPSVRPVAPPPAKPWLTREKKKPKRRQPPKSRKPPKSPKPPARPSTFDWGPLGPPE